MPTRAASVHGLACFRKGRATLPPRNTLRAAFPQTRRSWGSSTRLWSGLARSSAASANGVADARSPSAVRRAPARSPRAKRARMSWRTIYGPIPSRRLGRSLGISPIPDKTCNYSCIYCMLGRTDHFTNERRDWFPLQDILAELDDALRTIAPPPEHISIVGNGEPTLYLHLGELIAGVRQRTDIPVAVITNGALLSEPDVRTALAAADVVLVSFNAPTEELFRRINRPCPGITLESTRAGLLAFARMARAAAVGRDDGARGHQRQPRGPRADTLGAARSGAGPRLCRHARAPPCRAVCPPPHARGAETGGAGARRSDGVRLRRRRLHPAAGQGPAGKRS